MFAQKTLIGKERFKTRDYTEKSLINYLRMKKIKVYYLDITLQSLKKYGFAVKVIAPNFIQFGSKEGPVFKNNLLTISKSRKSKRHPFV